MRDLLVAPLVLLLPLAASSEGRPSSLLLGGFATLQASQTDTAQKPVVIDGSKNPEKFPEWFIWERVFESLPLTSHSSERVNGFLLPPLHVRLGVSEADLPFLLKEAKLFQQSKEVLAKQLRDTRAALLAQGKNDDQIQDATQEVNLQYRHRILDARGRVYQELSPASLERLRKSMNQQLSGTTVHLRGRAVAYFHLPW